MDRISILIPVKNGKKYINKSIDENIQNLKDDDEIIFIDDNSIDDTFLILKELANKNKQIRVFKNPGSGLVSALNFGVKVSNSDWIARSDIDDEYLSYRLDKQRELIGKDIAAIFCDYVFIDENSNYLGVIRSGVLPNAMNISLINSERTPHPGVLFNKIAFNNSGGYLAEDFPVEDLSLWYRLSSHGNLISCPKVLFRYRIHNNSIVSQKKHDVIRMKKIVLKKQVFDQSYFKKFIWLKTFFEYKNISQCTERRILYLRDLFTYVAFHRKYLKLINILFLTILSCILNPNFICVALKLRKFQKKRILSRIS